MKQLDKFSIDHSKVDGARLHNDLNRLVEHLNQNFKESAASATAASQTIATQSAKIADLEARIKVLESAQPTD